MDRLLQKDLVVRILSLLLAVVIWGQVSSDQNSVKRRQIDVPLLIIERPVGFQVTRAPATVSVELQGLGRVVDRVNPADLKAYASMRGFKEAGTFDVPADVTPPNGVTVVGGTGHVSITIEQLLELHLKPVVTPEAAEIVGDRRIQVQQPDREVLVSGLASAASHVDHLVANVDTSGVDHTVEREVTLHAVDKDAQEVKGVTISPERLRVSIAVTALPPGRMVPVRPHFQGSLPDGFTMTSEVDPKEAKVRKDPPGTWTEVLTEPVPLAGQTKSFSSRVRLVKPADAAAVDEQYATVSVTVTEVRDQRVLKNVPLRVVNLPPNLNATLSVTEVQVTLSGLRHLITALDNTKVDAYIDVEGLQAGEHRLRIAVGGAAGLDAAVVPDTVAVTLTPKA